ncbi:hypothetical protein [Dactylosporangium sp. NPDC000521]|uniref:hypothetical protein n=1 Tax=Dactylosporangium sp. NPDC000521 TaxID=3363975 RepID=UPI00367C51EE
MADAQDPAERRMWTLYDSGRRSLQERLYREAESTLAQYLSLEPWTPKSAKRRARAHAFIALAILARTPPLSRSTREVNHVISRLRNAPKLPLSAVLAAFLCETFYQTDDWNAPEDVQALAKNGAVDQLDRADIKLLLGHLPGMFGPTWEAVRRRAGFFGLAQDPPEPVDDERVDTWRRKAVRRYFAEIPRKVDDPRWGLTWFLLSAGLALGIMPCGGLYVTTKWYVGLLAVVGLYATSAILLFFGIVMARDCVECRKKIRERNAAIAATQPQASESELDAWLQEDVDRAIRHGADLHRLNLKFGIENAGLLMAPQAIVGISKLAGRYSAERLERDASSPSGLRTVIRRLPLAKTRIGEDGRLRASHYQVLVMYLTERRIGVFECNVDLATRRILAQSTYSFSYDDVITMSSQKIAANDSQENPNILIDRDGSSRTIFGDNRFIMSLVNGQKIEVSTAVNSNPANGAGALIAWQNDKIQRSIERMVWALKDSRVA